jgi:hypothetical protein
MRMLVHVQAYGDAARVPQLVARHSGRIREQINAREYDEVERLEAEYADTAARRAKLETEVAEKRVELERLTAKTAREKADAALAKLQGQRDKAAAKVAERDEKVADSRRRAEDDRRDVEAVGKELEIRPPLSHVYAPYRRCDISGPTTGISSKSEVGGIVATKTCASPIMIVVLRYSEFVKLRPVPNPQLIET